MKTLIKTSLMLIAASAVVLGLQTSANAAPKVKPRGEVTFTFVFEAPPPDQLQATIHGGFKVEGAIKDCGQATETFELTVPEFTASGMKTLEGRRGTILMSFGAQLYDGGLWGEAQWEMIGGTGAYKKLRGSGEGSVWMVFPEEGPPYLAAEYTGCILKDPSLK
jgi:hypothetical protein